MTESEFMAAFAPTGKRTVTEIDLADVQAGSSPFIVVRSGSRTLIINPQPLTDHLSVDVFAFDGGQPSTAAAFGMTGGCQYNLEPTGHTSLGRPGAPLIVVMLGEQGGTEPVEDGRAVRITGGTWRRMTGRVIRANKSGSYQVRLDSTVPGLPGRTVTIQARDAEITQGEAR